MVGVSNPVGASISRRFIVAVARAFQRVLPAARGKEISVVLVDRRTSRRLNRTYRGVNLPTDVLSFPSRDTVPWPGPDRTLGEVVICYPIAVRQARQLNHSVYREVAELFVHGLAHLSGFDHDTPKASRKMAEFEEKVVARILKLRR